MDIELAVDAMELADTVDHFVIFSGDGDFRSLVEALQRNGRKVSVVSTMATQPPMISDELRRQADHFIDLHVAAGPRSAARHPSGRRPDRPMTKNDDYLIADVTLTAAETSPDCPLCPRLHDFIAEWRRARAGLAQCAGADFPSARGRESRRLADRRAGAGPARRQPHRAALHRRLCRRSAL